MVESLTSDGDGSWCCASLNGSEEGMAGEDVDSPDSLANKQESNSSSATSARSSISAVLLDITLGLQDGLKQLPVHLRDSFLSDLRGFTPPCVVFMGDRRVGKTRVLKAFHPFIDQIVPECSTTMPVILQLRHATDFDHSDAQIRWQTRERAFVTEDSAGVEDESWEVGNFQDAKERMRQLLVSAGPYVQTNQSFVLELRHPELPTMDLVDLPGLVAPAGSRKKVEAVYRQLLRSDQCQGHNSTFVVVAPANQELSTSLALDFITVHGLAPRAVIASLILDKDGKTSEREPQNYIIACRALSAHAPASTAGTSIAELHDQALASSEHFLWHLRAHYRRQLRSCWEGKAAGDAVELQHLMELQSKLFGNLPDPEQLPALLMKEIERRLGPTSPLQIEYKRGVRTACQLIQATIGRKVEEFCLKPWESEDVDGILQQMRSFILEHAEQAVQKLEQDFRGHIQRLLAAKIALKSGRAPSTWTLVLEADTDAESSRLLLNIFEDKSEMEIEALGCGELQNLALQLELLPTCVSMIQERCNTLAHDRTIAILQEVAEMADKLCSLGVAASWAKPQLINGGSQLQVDVDSSFIDVLASAFVRRLISPKALLASLLGDEEFQQSLSAVARQGAGEATGKAVQAHADLASAMRQIARAIYDAPSSCEDKDRQSEESRDAKDDEGLSDWDLTGPGLETGVEARSGAGELAAAVEPTEVAANQAHEESKERGEADDQDAEKDEQKETQHKRTHDVDELACVKLQSINAGSELIKGRLSAQLVVHRTGDRWRLEVSRSHDNDSGKKTEKEVLIRLSERSITRLYIGDLEVGTPGGPLRGLSAFLATEHVVGIHCLGEAVLEPYLNADERMEGFCGGALLQLQCATPSEARALMGALFKALERKAEIRNGTRSAHMDCSWPCSAVWRGVRMSGTVTLLVDDSGDAYKLQIAIGVADRRFLKNDMIISMKLNEAVRRWLCDGAVFPSVLRCQPVRYRPELPALKLERALWPKGMRANFQIAARDFPAFLQALRTKRGEQPQDECQ